MKLVAYHTENSVPELLKLCSKIIKNGKSAVVRVGSVEEAKVLSEALWKLYNFLPHGIAGEDFEKIQPIIISWKNEIRDIFINFEKIHVPHTAMGHSAETFILWNCENYDKSFKVYRQDKAGMWGV